MRPYFTVVPSPNFFRPIHREIRAIIVHATETSGIESPINEFLNADTKKSAHYIIGKDGKVVRMVEELDIAYHAGESQWGGLAYKNPSSGKTTMNHCSVGIELVNLCDGKDPYTAPQIDALVSLLAAIAKDYSIPLDHIIGHEDIAPGRKHDPGPAFPWDEVRSRVQAA